MHVGRVKGSRSSTDRLSGPEMRMLRRLKREQTPASSYAFTTERKGPFAPRGFRQMIERLGEAAGFEFPVHHMLRHATGYKLANDGHPTQAVGTISGIAAFRIRPGIASWFRPTDFPS